MTVARVDIRADFGAKGNGSTDDFASLQGANDALAPYGGGEIIVPAGNYLTSRTWNLTQRAKLVGFSDGVASVTAMGDFTTIAFLAYHSSMEDICVVGSMSPGARSAAVTIADNIPINMRDSRIWGGRWGLVNNGVDGKIDNCFIMGAARDGGCVLSRGANWYERVKLDTSGQRLAFAFRQEQAANVPGSNGMMENHFTDSDFSGDLDYSMVVDDPAGLAVTVVHGGVLSSPIALLRAKITILVGCELGSEIYNTSPLIIDDCFGMGPTPIRCWGPGPRTTGNYNVSI